MKKSHLILLVLLIVAIGYIFYTLMPGSETYATFPEASNNPDRTYHVVGTLNKEKEMIYNPVNNANLFSFYLLDKDGNEKKVLLNKAKPMDFEKSEQIVVIGKMKGDIFYAKDILTKCPSKYSDTQTQEVK
jgi:cytochrome c-type biogenesis protein CcmE